MNFVPFKEMIIEMTFTNSTIIASRARKLNFDRFTSVLQGKNFKSFSESKKII